MSLELRLTCDCCTREFESDYTAQDRLSVEKLKREAHREGWKFLHHSWFCDRCMARAKRLEESQRKENAS